MAQALGIIDVIWMGTKIPADKGSGSFDTGGMQNKTVVAGRQVHRAHEMKEGMAELTTPLLAGMSLTDLFFSGDGELQINCDTGQQFVVSDAFLITTPNAKEGSGGNVKMTWNFGQAVEIS